MDIALTDLDPSFRKITDEKGSHQPVASIAEADGIMFLCPKCYETKGGPIGTHMVICWRPRVPQTIGPKPGRWEFQGTDLADLTLVAGSSSIQLKGGCNWHGYIRNGRATNA